MDLRKAQSDPSYFRDCVLINADSGPVRLSDVLDGWQGQDFAALDAGVQRVAGVEPSGKVFLRAYLERPRGHSKTLDIAVSAAWVLFAAKRKLFGVVAAADKDQAGLFRDAVDGLCRLNPWLARALDVQRERIVNKHTGSELVILSSDAPTSYGLTPDFVICDELTHWGRRDLWDSLLSAAAKRSGCMLLVISNAGFSESWQWETREAIRQDPAWYFHRLDGCCASWISGETLAEQRRLLPAPAYNRLWLNRWTDGSGDALTGSDIDAAVTLTGELAGPEKGWAYIGGLDLGLSRDASALVVLGKHVGYTERRPKPTRQPASVAMRAMLDLGLIELSGIESQSTSEYVAGTGALRAAAVHIWSPTDGRKVDLEQVEQKILEVNRAFKLSCLGCDPWQAEYLTQRLRKQQVAVEPVGFTGMNLQAMATATLDAFREKQIELFPHAELLSDLKSLRVVERQYGFRLESPKRNAYEQGTRHGDTATALAIALYIARRFRWSLVETGRRKLVYN